MLMNMAIGIMAVLLSSALVAQASVKYEDFGAKGDSTHDDRAAIVAAHKAANATAHPIDAKRLVITGGVFVTRANHAPSRYTYYSRGIRVERSNVEISDMRHEVTDEIDHGAPYSAFVGVIGCADVTVRDCVFTAHKTYMTDGHGGRVSMGSYDLSCWHAVNVSFVNCRQTTDIGNRAYWGIFGSNFSRNLLFDGCSFSRFDAHMGVANATVKNCKIGYMGLSSIGFGTFLVENTTIRANGFVRLRGDYGCTWDGDFIIRNCTYVPNGGKTVASVFTGRNDGTHDFGYVCHLPRKVTVDGLFIDDTEHPKGYAGPCLFGNITGDAKAKYAMRVTEEIVLNNVSTASGKALRPFERPEAFAQTRVSIQ